jgi:molybdopterin adenylyltransferase
MSFFTGILTISDRAARGRYADQSGPALRRAAEGYGWQVHAEAIVPDDKDLIQQLIRKQISDGCRLVLTTGGTGITPRDVTPEAVQEIATRELPGFGEVMRAESLKLTPHALLSRCLAAVVGEALVVCLPGKPSGAVECLGFVASAIPHCVDLLGHAETATDHSPRPLGE